MKGSRSGLRATKLALVNQFGGKCQRCGYHRCMRALQFHHADSSEKELWSKKTGKVSPAEVRAHPERFLLLCANCHFEEHDRIDQEAKLRAVCRSCGETFLTEPHRANSRRGKYCSRECQHGDKHKVAIANISDRAWKHIEKVGECWVWTGYAQEGTPVMAYPVGYRKNTIKPVARVLWEIEHGPLEKDQQVWRSCKTPGCVRPDHQIIGTKQSMMRSAGRARRAALRNGNKPTAVQGMMPWETEDDISDIMHG